MIGPANDMYRAVSLLKLLIDKYDLKKSDNEDWQVDFKSNFESLDFHMKKFNDYIFELEEGVKAADVERIKEGVFNLRTSSLYILGYYENLFDDLDVLVFPEDE